MSTRSRKCRKTVKATDLTVLIAAIGRRIGYLEGVCAASGVSIPQATPAKQQPVTRESSVRVKSYDPSARKVGERRSIDGGVEVCIAVNEPGYKSRWRRIE